MKWLHWKIEAEPTKPGLNVYKFNDPGSIGFVLDLDRAYIRVRYSKITRLWRYTKIKREPRIWRILASKDTW